MTKQHDHCPMMDGGLCAIAYRGHALCKPGAARCHIDSAAKADKAYDEIVERLSAEGRALREKREAEKVTPP